MDKSSYILGFDFGMRCIGVAIGQTLSTQAKPLAILKAKQGKPDWSLLDKLCEEWMVKGFVVGYPDGEQVPQFFQSAIVAFVESLKDRYQLSVHLVDEHYTTQEARQRSMDQKSKSKRHDDVAAAIILESWLNQHNRDMD